MAISDFFDTLGFWPPKSKMYFWKVIPSKIQNFQVFQKTEYMLSRYIETTRMQNFKAIGIFIFGCAIAQKPG